ncbi:MAG: FG-GAP repeat protein [Anaerolineae bacterium]|nr:FG-GAP repeat protein [Anaerolineae bacterium]
MCKRLVITLTLLIGLISLMSLPTGLAAPDSETSTTDEVPTGGLAATPTWTYENNHPGAELGSSVSTAGDVNGDGYDDIIVGAPLYDGGTLNSGRAYAFYGSPIGPSVTPDWTADPPVLYYEGRFGIVSTAGDVNGDGYDDVMVSMQNYDNVNSDEGAVYVWYGSASGLGTNYDWMAESNLRYAHMGIVLDSAGDVNGDGYDDIIVGAHRYDYNNVSHAYVWFGSATGLDANGSRPVGYPSNADWYASAPTYNGDAGHAFGTMVSTAGDVNGDGYDDVLVGARDYDDSSDGKEGAVFVWYGSETGLGDPGTIANADWMAVSNQAYSRFGWSGGTAGDVNGDGYGDIIVGAYYYDNPDSAEGGAFAWYGSETGLDADGTRPSGDPSNADWWAEGNEIGFTLGNTVGTAGDVDQDGYDDALVTAYSNNIISGTTTITNAGVALVWYGSAAGLSGDHTPASADWWGKGDQIDGNLTYPGQQWCPAADTAGDVNGDGLSDIIAGAPLYDHPTMDEGRAFVFLTNPWFKEIYVNDVLTDTMPIAIDAGDTVEIVDRGFVNGTSTITFTLVETWTQSFNLTGWNATTGSVITTANTLTWEATDVATDTWHVITKTFSVSFSPEESDTVTESLWLEHYDFQLPERVLQFTHEVRRVFLPLVLRED